MTSIKNKISIPIVALGFLITAAILLVCIFRFTSYIQTSVSHELESGSNNLLAKLEDYRLMSAQSAQIIASDAHLISNLESGNRDAVVKQAYTLQTGTGMDFCTILDPEGNVIARAHEPDNFGDSLANQSNIQSAMKGEAATFVETGSAVKLSVRSSAPIFDENNKLTAIVSVGKRLDQNDFVDDMKTLTGMEVTVFLGDERIATTVIGDDGNRAVGTQATKDVSETVLAGSEYMGTTMVVGQKADVKYVPLTESGKVIGMLFVGRYTKPSEDAIRSFVIIGVAVGLAAMVLAVIFSLIVSGRIVNPILSLVNVGEEIAKGNIEVEVNVSTNDEIQKLADSFGHIIAANRAQAGIIKAMSEGDLTVDVPVRSDKDVVNIALKNMVEMNNKIFSEISESALKVASGAKNISAGAEELANASTTQAASVEQLSAAVLEVSVQAENNARMASDGKALGDTIMTTTSKGSEQMTNMSRAVEDINEASRSIESVIKTIDDIAFQTNILALNASVEAARAGQHGKGFAVVADEVRNLAGKSAEAASSTNGLIENSINKARAGSQIARETAESLAEIVDGVKQSSQIMTDIASSSVEQSNVINQISSGVDNVSRIIQENSTTAQLSAAESQVMSQQADELQRLVSRFKLKNTHLAASPAASGRRNDSAGFSI